MERKFISGEIPKLTLLCGTDQLRPALTGIYIHKGACIATDAQTLVVFKPKSKEVQELIALFEGKIIKQKLWQLLQATESFSVEGEYLTLYTKTNKKQIAFPITINTENKEYYIDEKFPNFENVINLEAPKDAAANVIGLNISFLARFQKALSVLKETNLSFNFHIKEANRAVLISPSNYDLSQEFLFLIMPRILDFNAKESLIHSPEKEINKYLTDLKTNK